VWRYMKEIPGLTYCVYEKLVYETICDSVSCNNNYRVCVTVPFKITVSEMMIAIQ